MDFGSPRFWFLRVLSPDEISIDQRVSMDGENDAGIGRVFGKNDSGDDACCDWKE